LDVHAQFRRPSSVHILAMAISRKAVGLSDRSFRRHFSFIFDDWFRTLWDGNRDRSFFSQLFLFSTFANFFTTLHDIHGSFKQRVCSLVRIGAKEYLTLDVASAALRTGGLLCE